MGTDEIVGRVVDRIANKGKKVWTISAVPFHHPTLGLVIQVSLTRLMLGRKYFYKSANMTKAQLTLDRIREWCEDVVQKSEKEYTEMRAKMLPKRHLWSMFWNGFGRKAWGF